VLIWGGPGTGKTSFINQVARRLDVPIETIIASIREPSDFAGLPVVKKEGVVFEPPAWACRLSEVGERGGILFIDEISTTPPAVQAALLRVIHEGVVGDITLPPTVSKVAAANPPEQAAGGWTLAPPLANRFVHFEWGLDHERWADGAIDRWKTSGSDIPILPEDWEAGIPEALSLVSAYIRHRPAHLYALPQHEAEAGMAWPSPRTWEMAAILMAAADATGVSDDVRVSMVAGAIGSAAALEFINWTKDLDLPDPEFLLENPNKYKVPKRSDQVYAVLSSVLAAAINNLTKERWMATWSILAKTAQEKAPDIAAFAARTLIRKVDLNSGLPIPKKEIAVFHPILKEAGII
jgi:hypothetical protein